MEKGPSVMPENGMENAKPKDAVDAAEKIIAENGSKETRSQEDINEEKWKEQIEKSRAARVKVKKYPSLGETKRKLERKGIDIQSLDTPKLKEAAESLKNPMGPGWEVIEETGIEPAKQEKVDSSDQKGPLTTVEGLLERVEAEKPSSAGESQAEVPKLEPSILKEASQEGSLNTVDSLMARVESDKAQSEKRNMIKEAKQITKENTPEYLESLTKNLQQELGDNLILERAGLTDSGFEIVITDQNGKPVYDVNELPKESLSTYETLKNVLAEELKNKYNSAQVDAAVAKGEANAKAKSGLWSRVKKFFGGK